MKNSTNRILVIAVILLLLANIALVAMMVMGKQGGRGKKAGNKGGSLEMMTKELDMTEQQRKDYEQLKEEHLNTIRPFHDSVRAAKTAFFNLAKDPSVNDSIVDIYSQRIAERQAAADKLTLAHFRKVRNLFNPEQQIKFDEFIKKMMQQRQAGKRKDSTRKDR
jgi:Spy/CpxP family protein refolding chaperone